MSADILTGCASAGFATVLLLGPARPRLRVPATPSSPATDRALLLRWRPMLSALAFLGGWLFVGGPLGLLGGTTAAFLAWRVLGRAEGPGTRRRREELERDLPVAVHLLGACLDAGAATTGALGAVSDALPGAVAEELALVRHRLALGADPAAVWREVGDHPELRPLGRAMSRAHRSGASARDAISGLADELSARSRARTDIRARGVEVRAAAPLGVCFLPAFVLLGVVPMVAGVFSAMRLFA